MSGELLLENESWWKSRLPAAVLAALVSALLCWAAAPLLNRWHMTGLTRQVTVALLALILWWAVYPVISRAFPGRGQNRRTAWTLTADTLLLGDVSIPLDEIKMVHCWPNRSALGTAGAGWTVNIETAGKNRVLRSLTRGEDSEQSARLLRELVTALGYGSQWRE